MTLALAREDWKKFTTTGGFEVDLTLTSTVPFSVENAVIVNGQNVVLENGNVIAVVNYDQSITIKGIYAKHHNSIGTDGMPVNAKLTRVSFSESILTLCNYPLRNDKGEVSMFKHLVDFMDSTGVLKHYIVKEVFPDETVGVITCILGDYGY